MRPHGRSIEFRLGTSLLRVTSLTWMLAVIFGLPLLVLLIVILFMVAGSGESLQFGEALDSVWKSINEDSSLDWLLVAAAVLTPVALISLMLQRTCYLRLTDVGIEAHLPWWTGLRLVGLTTGTWILRWDSIRSVRLMAGSKKGKPALTLAGYRLLIETDRGEKRISPFPWILPDGPDHRLTLREMVPSKGLDAAKVVERAPLLLELRARGLEFSSELSAPESVPRGYDLARHPGMIAQLATLFVAGLYALIDIFFLDSFMALEPLPTAPFVIVTVAGAAMAFALGKGAPAMERGVVGFLMVGALTAAVYPGLLRFNALTAEPQEIPYVAVGAGRFESTIPGLPEIDLSKIDVPEYWSEYPEGSAHEFDLMHGAGDFFQVDLRPLYARTREYYSPKT